jgi:cytochrome oxidase Cu insertion factor (SCO1/SenC/PrrC family)
MERVTVFFRPRSFLQKRIYIGLIIILMLGFAFVTGCSSNQDEIVHGGEVGASVGDAAPGFTLSDLDGNQVSLSDFKGKTVFINFWASW